MDLSEEVQSIKEEVQKPESSRPIRCFEGTARPYEPFWKWIDAIDKGEPEMELYGYISEYSWFEDKITPKKFKDQLYKTGKGGPITIRMNSGGGDVTAASAIRAMLMDYPGRVTVRIDGLAASAATVVATAGKVVKIQDTAYYMIHDPAAAFFMAVLNIEELSRLTDSLKAIKEGIINAYTDRTGMSRGRLGQMMTSETWMDAQKAIDLGFADEIVATDNKNKIEIPQNAAIINALQNFRNVPPAVLKAMTFQSRLTEQEQRQAERLREEVNSILRGDKTYRPRPVVD
jgi:ATP-dependent Clp protease protease subunit